MEVVPIALLGLWILIVIFAWSLGASVRAKSLVALGVSGLVVTVFGVALCIGLAALLFAGLEARVSHTAPPSLPGPPRLYTVVPAWVWLVAPGFIVVLGVLLTSAACAIGLRKAVRGHADRYIRLLAGALLLLIWFSLTLLFAVAHGNVPRPDVLNVYRFTPVALLGWVAAPIVAAVVTTRSAKKLTA